MWWLSKKKLIFAFWYSIDSILLEVKAIIFLWYYFWIRFHAIHAVKKNHPQIDRLEAKQKSRFLLLVWSFRNVIVVIMIWGFWDEKSLERNSKITVCYGKNFFRGNLHESISGGIKKYLRILWFVQRKFGFLMRCFW